MGIGLAFWVCGSQVTRAWWVTRHALSMLLFKAASIDPSRRAVTPAQLGQGGGEWGKGGSMARLNLTLDQTAKIEQLRASARTQMDAILTPTQQQQAKARQDRRQAMGDTWKSLNLTTEQQARIKTIRQSSAQQLNAILTPEQQTKLKSSKHDRGYNLA